MIVTSGEVFFSQYIQQIKGIFVRADKFSANTARENQQPASVIYHLDSQQIIY